MNKNMRLCDYRHQQIKEGAELQIKIMKIGGELQHLSQKKLLMMGADYALAFVQVISEYNPEDFCDLLNEDDTTKFVAAIDENETPIWTRRIFKDGIWQWETSTEKDIIGWIPICSHITITRHDDE